MSVRPIDQSSDDELFDVTSEVSSHRDAKLVGRLNLGLIIASIAHALPRKENDELLSQGVGRETNTFQRSPVSSTK
jgi:hypothetical protein